MQIKRKVMLGMTMILAVAAVCMAFFSSNLAAAVDLVTDVNDADLMALEGLRFGKNLAIWFMLMLVAFLMIFIKKYEWGVALAVLLSAAGSFVVYLAIQDLYFGAAWDQLLLIRGVVCAITVVIAIGVFLGTVKQWQYLLVGVLFAFVYSAIDYIMGNIEILGAFATDPGGSMLVHMCAAYFGIGVALAIREKRAFEEPMYTSTHSVSFVWLAAMLLWVLWPAFVSSMLPLEQVAWATITCYMAGIGSVISAWLVCTIVQKKVNPLIYTYAMLAGPVAIGAPLLLVGPWGAIAIGLVAGAISALAFIYLQPWLCKKMGVLDVMGVHNLHGVGGWIGVFASVIALCALNGFVTESFANIVFAVIVLAIAIGGGILVGLVVKLTRGTMSDEELFSDDADFIKNEEPI